MSSFKGFKDLDLEDDDSIITVDSNRANIIRVKGQRYRKFINDSQNHIWHYIIILKEVPKIFVRGNWYYRIEKHSCEDFHCVDENG